jgi:hypothetical protein
MDTLQTYIENKDISNIQNELHNLINIGYKTNNILSFLINLYSEKYISKNIWVLKELHENISLIENKSAPIEELLCNISVLISLNNKKSVHIYKSVDYNEIKEILFTSSYINFENINEFKNVFVDETYDLLNILYGNLSTRKNINKTFIIINYLINCTKKKLFKSKTIIDIIDYIFIILIKKEFICDYVMILKDLFYYRCKKADKLLRINMLYYCVFVIINKQITDQVIDYKNNVVKEPTNYDYLYIKFNLDKDYVNQINMEKSQYKPELTKDIQFTA